ncbi:MAG: hypothetical protein HY238_09805 [Acidobacteria bacterium]|nr:hypothetical protein [Acidobacteriota bacterium]
MKKLFLVVLALSLPALAQDNPNFSGTWELQVAKSEFGPLPAPESQVSVIDHKEPKLQIKVTSKTAQGEQTSTRNLTTDGEENTNQVANNTWKSKTHWEEKVLITESSFEIQGNKIRIKDRWTLAGDGKSYTSDRELASDMGEAQQKLVFAKK